MKIDENVRPLRVTSTAREMNQSDLSMRLLLCASLSDHPTTSEGFQTQLIATVAVTGTGSPVQVSARGDSLSAGVQLPTRMQPNLKSVFSGSPFPSRGPSTPSRQEWSVDAQDHLPGHNGKWSNRRYSSTSARSLGSKRVSLTLIEHRAYSTTRPVISDLIKTLTYLLCTALSPWASSFNILCQVARRGLVLRLVPTLARDCCVWCRERKCDCESKMVKKRKR